MAFGTIIRDSGVSFDNYVCGKNTLVSDKCKIEYFSNKLIPQWYILVLLVLLVLLFGGVWIVWN